jgi:Flp pilus assembly protein TadG
VQSAFFYSNLAQVATMFRNIRKKACGIGREERSVIALLFAILILPLLTVMAIAVDLSQFLVMKQQLRAALDAAALDIGQSPTLSDPSAATEAQAFITANYPALSVIGTLQSVTVTRTATTVVITANATMNTNFLQIIGYRTMGVSVSSQISVNLNKLEVVLVLDNTGSMSSTYGGMSGINGLKTAATALVNTLFANDPTLQYVKVGVVPFTAAVNVGTQYATAPWLDSGGVGTMTRENLNVPNGQGLIQFATRLQNARWGGCVRARTEPYDVEDVAPTPGFPNTLFTPYFAPSEPSNLYNHYLSDGSFSNGTTQAQIQYSVTKYTNGSVQNLPNYGPNFDCTVQPIIRLTNDQSAILNEINAMDAYGATVVPAGLMWGWHLLSPYGPFGDGVAYSDNETIKAIILVTDGQNDVQLGSGGVTPTSPTNGFDKSVYNAYGYGSGPHLNILSLPAFLSGVQDPSNYNLDQKEIQLCNNIKAVTDASGNTGRIQIFAIGFGSSINSNALTLLSQCASSAANYFHNPTSESLISTFQQIAIGLNQLRISR